ncbi:MAG: NUDIX hydrolase [Actinobacteria bacterium]|nr:NUDIX hydrolase [Actinomycetota bacterium]
MPKRRLRRGYALITRKGKVLIVRNRRGRWTLPGGRARPDEKVRKAAVREVREELGVKVRLKARVSGPHVRHHARPCGKCVVFRAKIDKGKPAPHREIVEMAWVTPDKALQRLRAYRRKELRRIFSQI